MNSETTLLKNCCPHCNSAQIRQRKAKQDWVCYNCQATFPQPNQRPMLRESSHPWQHQKELQKQKLPTREMIYETAQTIQDERARVLYVLAYLTGGRITEILSLRKKDMTIQKVNNRMTLAIELRNLKNKRRMQKTLPIPFDGDDAKFLNLIRDYINEFNQDDLLFEGQNRMPMTKIRAYQILKKNADVNPHWMRHLRLSHLRLYYRFDAFELQKFAGWSDIKPAQHYMEIGWQDLLEKL